MGVVRKVQAGKMRVFIAVIAVIALAAASDFTPEEIMLEAQTDVADMKKKGATEKDCKDLAKTSCKEVVNEHTRSQKLINSLSTGSKCKYLGRGGIVKMLAHYRRTKKTWMSMKIKVSVASKAYVKIDSQRFSSLKQGKCGFVFSSRSYLTAGPDTNVLSDWRFPGEAVHPKRIRCTFVPRSSLPRWLKGAIAPLRPQP